MSCCSVCGRCPAPLWGPFLPLLSSASAQAAAPFPSASDLTGALTVNKPPGWSRGAPLEAVLPEWCLCRQRPPVLAWPGAECCGSSSGNCWRGGVGMPCPAGVRVQRAAAQPAESPLQGPRPVSVSRHRATAADPCPAVSSVCLGPFRCLPSPASLSPPGRLRSSLLPQHPDFPVHGLSLCPQLCLCGRACTEKALSKNVLIE